MRLFKSIINIPVFFILFFFGGLFLNNFARAEHPLTLRDCYELALKQSETVAIQEANIRIAEKKFAQAIGAVLPHIHFKGSEFLQDDSSTDDGAGALGQTFTSFSRPELKFNAKQPLFSGLREYYSMAAIKTQRRQNSADWENAKRLLFIDVAKSFYTVLQLEKDVAILKNIDSTLSKRLNEEKTRAKLGKDRSSERLNTESEQANQQASLSMVEGGLASAKEVLTFFTGVGSDSLSDDVTVPAELDEERYLRREKIDRPDIVSAEEAKRFSKYQLNIQKGGMFPTINAEANYYTLRSGFQEGINWDATFSLDFPLFEGGQTKAKIQEAKLLLKQADLQLSEKKRQADLEIKKAYQDFVSSKKQAAAFENAATKAQQSYKASEEDYHNGLINNLQLLELLRRMEEVQRNYVRTSLQTKLSWLNLKASAGEPLP
ncbi:MAG: TolC family protein [Deltaproteobacteria bacterium]|nr:TolC family protein [Deltaproteobacteria bacterium]